MAGSPDRYDKIHRHDHLICKKCGTLSDITFRDITGDLEKQLGEGIISYDLNIFYLCPKCREKSEYEEESNMKSTKYAGTQTKKNLETAFSGESQARNKYTYFASVAKKEGYEQIASLFLKQRIMKKSMQRCGLKS